MAKFSEVPTFVSGDPGFAAKLNQLGTVVTEVIEALNALTAAVESCKAPVAKTATRKAATTK